MAFAIGKVACIRKGKLIPAGTKFQCSQEEKTSLEALGFEFIPESTNSGNIKSTANEASGVKSGNTKAKNAAGNSATTVKGE